MKSILTIMLMLFCFHGNTQTFEFYKSLIDLSKDSAISILKKEGFKVTKEDSNDDCFISNFEKDNTTIIYSFCPDSIINVVCINIIERKLETSYEMLFQVKNDESLILTKGYICGDKSYLFENDEIEVSFLFDHFNKFYNIEVSNSYRYDFKKEFMESKQSFDYEKNGKVAYRNMVSALNKEGISVEEILENSNIKNDFTIVTIAQALKYIEEFRLTKEFDSLKDIIDENFLSDPDYINTFRFELEKLQFWLRNQNNYDIDDKLIIIGIEEDRFKTMIMLDYICESVILK